MVRIGDAAAERMRLEGVTADAVAQVLAAGRAAGNLVVDESDGSMTTHAELDNLTLWVRFAEQGDDVEVLDAYYHRIAIGPSDGQAD